MKSGLFIISIFFILLLNFCSEPCVNEKEKIKPIENPQKVASFPVIGKLRQIFIKNEYIFIKDKKNIYCYDLNSFKFIKKLIKIGEGPSEFIRVPLISFSKYIYILQSMNKIVFLNKSFEYIGELRASSLSMGSVVSLGKNFVIGNYRRNDKKDGSVFNLVDQKLNRIKTITSYKNHNGSTYFNIFLKTKVWDDKLFVAKPAKGLYFDVFDKNGIFIYNIDKNIRKIKTEKKHVLRKEEILLYRMGERMFKEWKALPPGKDESKVPTYLPDINDYWINNDKIYVKTYDLKNKTEKYIIMDLNGKIIKIVYLPISYIGTFAFYDNKFYYLKDNGKNESWDLYSIQL